MVGMSDAALSAGDPTTSEPPKEPPTSFVAGIGFCVWDEIIALWDLAAFLIELGEDFDVAADGKDNWFANPIIDAAKTGLIVKSLASGNTVMGDYSPDHQIALTRIYTKVELVKSQVLEIMSAGAQFTAAYDKFIDGSPLRNGLPFMIRELLGQLVSGISIFYTPEEWDIMAEEGKVKALEFIELIAQEFKSRPWYAAGYALCIIATLVIPITKVTAAIKALRPVLKVLDSTNTSGGFDVLLKDKGQKLPEYLGGRDQDYNLDRDNDFYKDYDDDFYKNRKGSDEDANPKRAEDPQRPPNWRERTATIIKGAGTGRRSNLKGNLAETQARRDLLNEGYDEVISVQNGSGHGVDVLGINRGADGAISGLKAVEVKSNTANLGKGSKASKLGPEGFLRNSLRHLNNRALREEIRNALDKKLPFESEVWRYTDVDDATGAIGGRQKSDWQKNQPTQFEVDSHFDPVELDALENLSDYLQERPGARAKWFNLYPDTLELLNPNGTIRQ